MASDLVERLLVKRVRVHDLSGVGYETDPDCSEAVARMTVDAARIAALEAELAEARAERDQTFQDGWDAHEAHIAMHSEPFKFAFPTMLRKMWSGGRYRLGLTLCRRSMSSNRPSPSLRPLRRTGPTKPRLKSSARNAAGSKTRRWTRIFGGTLMDKEAIAKLIEHHRSDCSRMVYGQCSTRRCLVRGGWEAGDGSGYSKATCEALETCQALETLEAQLDGHALSAKQATDNLIRATAAEARAEKMAEALKSLVDQPCAYHGNVIHIPADSHGDAMMRVTRARAALGRPE